MTEPHMAMPMCATRHDALESMVPDLFSPLQLGPYELAHRIVHAPLTRQRALPGSNAPHALNVEYHNQRATPGGLIIAEASQVSVAGQCVPNSPGIYSAEQVAGWRAITDCVHQRGGRIFLQLWHTGRLSHSSYQPDGRPALSASAITASGVCTARDGTEMPMEVPRSAAEEQIAEIIEDYRRGAQNAMAAGFDGVELHGGRTYLLGQFLHTSSNQRTDRYGGSFNNRARLTIEAAAAAVDVWGKERVGLRIQPFGRGSGDGEADEIPLYAHVTAAAAELDLAYLSLVEPHMTPAGALWASAVDAIRPLWRNVLIDAGGYRPDTAQEAVRSGKADAIAFGRLFISNPDLVERIRSGAALTPYDRSKFYGGGPEGYTDFPFLNDIAA